MNVGGPARQVIELARGLRRFGYETTVATGEPHPWEGDLREDAEALGVRVVTIPGLGPRIRPAGDARAFAHLTRWLRREKPAIVHTHTAKGGALGRAAARAAGVPIVVHTFHGTVFDDYFGPFASRLIASTERWLARTTDRIVAVSHATADEVEAIGIDKEKLRVIEPVIDLAPFLALGGRSGHLRQRFGSFACGALIGWIGRFVPVKDPERFVQMAAILAAARADLGFVMVGAGPLEPRVRREVESRGLAPRFVITGFERSMAPVYADLDFLVSSSRREGMQVALLEAMAAGVLPVATSVGGAPELIADRRSGFLVPSAAPEALAEAVRGALELPAAELATLRTVARVRARERFGAARGLERHAETYDEIARRKGIRVC